MSKGTVTRIIIAEITMIKKEVTKEETEKIEKNTAGMEKLLKDNLKKTFSADDVHVKIKDFIKNDD